MKNVNPENTKEQIPVDLLNRITHVEEWYKKQSGPGSKSKIAVFDLDNTLLVGDCGDAVFTQLKIDEQKESLTITGERIPFSWTAYQEVLKTRGKVEAYSMIIKCMAGLPLQTLLDTTRKVMSTELEYLRLEGVCVQVPYPHPVMQTLVRYLKSLDYDIYIISATNQYTVRYTAWEFFGIPESHAFGMIPSVSTHPQYGEILDGGILGPVTVVEGKVDVYKKNISSIPPLITGGDSTTDIMMLNLVNPRGLTIWVGDDEADLESLKQQFKSPELIYFLKR